MQVKRIENLDIGNERAFRVYKGIHAMKKYYWSLIVGLLFLGALRVFAAQITSDYDHAVDLSQYKTYSWLKVQAGDSLWEGRIKQDIDSQLAAKGWTRVDSGDTATISAFQSTKDQQTLETFYDGFGGGWRWRDFGDDGISTTTTETTRIGSLTVDIFDAKTQKLIWRGKQSDALTSNPRKNADKLAKDLGSLFKHFPPSR
jgi:hypothetical protein